MTRVVGLVVMLSGYLPEMQSKHLIGMIMMVGMVNSLPDFLIGLIDKFDHPPGGTNIQMPDFDDSFALLHWDHLTNRT